MCVFIFDFVNMIIGTTKPLRETEIRDSPHSVSERAVGIESAFYCFFAYVASSRQE